MLARGFLDGVDDAPMDTLRDQMFAASDALAFERAASLRDKLARLEGLRASFSRLRFAVETLTFAYPVAGHGGDDRVYLVRRGRVVDEVDGRDGLLASEARLRALAASLADDPVATGRAIPAHEVDELLLLSSWFRMQPAELARAVRPDGSRPEPLALTA